MSGMTLLSWKYREPVTATFDNHPLMFPMKSFSRQWEKKGEIKRKKGK